MDSTERPYACRPITGIGCCLGHIHDAGYVSTGSLDSRADHGLAGFGGKQTRDVCFALKPTGQGLALLACGPAKITLSPFELCTATYTGLLTKPNGCLLSKHVCSKSVIRNMITASIVIRACCLYKHLVVDQVASGHPLLFSSQ